MTIIEINNIVEKCKRLGFTGLSIEELIEAFRIYLRKSRSDEEVERYIKMANPNVTKEELDKEILKRHEDQIQAYAKEILGFKIPEKFIRRELASGGELEERPIMKDILLEIEDPSILGVFVIDIDRIGRPDALDTGLLIQAFELTNTKIFVASPPKIWDLTNDFDKEYFEDSLRQARKFLNYTKTKMINGRRQSVMEGKFVGRIAPYGYNKVKLKDQKGYTLELNDDAEVVKEMFSMALQGMGSSVISRILNEREIKPPVKDIWQPNMVRNTLKRKTYAGFVTFSDSTTTKIKKDGVVKKVKRNNEDALVCKGIHEALVSVEDFEKVQELMKKKAFKNVPLTEELQNPLSGLAKCKCGYTLIRRKTRNGSIHDVRQNIDKVAFVKYLKQIKDEKQLTYKDITEATGIKRTALTNYFTFSRINLPRKEYYLKLKEFLGLDDRYDALLNQDSEDVVKDVLFCHNKGCNCVGSYIYIIEEEVLRQLREKLEEYNTFIDNYYQDEVIVTKDFKKEIEKLENDIAGLQKQISTACDLLERNMYTDEMFLSRVNELNSKIEVKKNKIKELQSIDIKKEIVQHEKAVPVLETALLNYHKFTTEEKNEFLHAFIEKIVYSKTTRNTKWSSESNMKLDITWKEF